MGCCGLIYFHCTLRIFLKLYLPSQLKYCVTGYSRSYQKFHSDPAKTRGRYISEGYLYFLSHYSRSYQNFLMTRRRLHHWKTYEYQLHWTLSSGIFIFFPQGKTQSVSENTISPPCTVQFPPFILSSSPLELFFLFTASKGILFFLKTSYLNLKHVYKMASILKEALTHANVTSDE